MSDSYDKAAGTWVVLCGQEGCRTTTPPGSGTPTFSGQQVQESAEVARNFMRLELVYEAPCFVLREGGKEF